nr:unnamed protein product [Callosobruchus analis]
MNELWLKLANRLNSMGFGEKSIDSWRKALTDWKSKTKTKAVTLKRENEKTGGGPKMLPPLIDLENHLLALMGKTAISGDEEIPELGFGEKTRDEILREKRERERERRRKIGEDPVKNQEKKTKKGRYI